MATEDSNSAFSPRNVQQADVVSLGARVDHEASHLGQTDVTSISSPQGSEMDVSHASISSNERPARFSQNSGEF